jgi:hypothetical protein
VLAQEWLPSLPDIHELPQAGARVADRVAFHVRDVTTGPPPADTYDLVCVFDAIHDMSRPVEALATMRAMAGDHGAVLVMDERAPETFEAPGDEIERLLSYRLA